jgi:hypothetical protein
MGALARQPTKGMVFSVASVPVALALWLLLRDVFGLEYGAGAVVFTVCFTWFWQIGWSFGGWPANRWTSSRWGVGAINWVLLMLAVWGTLALWGWYFDRPFEETEVGLWAQTTIIAGVISLFFFGNELLLPPSLAGQQPLSGFVNLIWGVLFLPFALLLLPKLAGANALYIPWIWFPVALVPMAYFGGWPFGQLGQPRAGVAYLGVTFAVTVTFLAILDRAGANFFGSGDEALRAAIFGATWTNVGLLLAWLFNMWPIGRWSQPLKGITGTVGTVAVSLLIYAVLMSLAGPAALPAILFGEFAFMWAQVSFAAVGLFNVFEWGHEEDPGGAGVGRPAFQAEARPGRAV